MMSALPQPFGLQKKPMVPKGQSSKWMPWNVVSICSFSVVYKNNVLFGEDGGIPWVPICPQTDLPASILVCLCSLDRALLMVLESDMPHVSTAGSLTRWKLPPALSTVSHRTLYRFSWFSLFSPDVEFPCSPLDFSLLYCCFLQCCWFRHQMQKCA